MASTIPDKLRGRHRRREAPHPGHRQPEGRRRQDHHRDQPGTALAAIGERVLIIDLDPQGNASTGLGIDRQRRVTSSTTS